MIFGKGQLWKRREVLSVLSALVVVPLLGCGGGGGTPDNGGNNGATATATFTGRVIDANNANRGVSGAVVQLNGANTTTGSDGSFTLLAPTNSAVAYATVVGPSNGYYKNGYVGGVQYNLVDNGFPVQPTTKDQTVDLGTVTLGGVDGPPFPPDF